MADAYRAGYKVMQERLQAVTALIEDAKARGETPEPRWLFQQDRWRQFYAAARDEITAYNKIAHGITTGAQDEAIGLGTSHMQSLMKESFGSGFEKYMGTGFTFARPNDAAMRAMVGYTSAGAPLMDLFESIWPPTRDRMGEVMRNAITIGANPAVTARMMQGPMGIPAWRSMTIARTETLRAYREAQRQTVLENDDVLEGWVWYSSRDARCCEVCWAMHGKVFPIGDIGGRPEPEPVPVPEPVDDPILAKIGPLRDSAAQWETTKPWQKSRAELMNDAAFWPDDPGSGNAGYADFERGRIKIGDAWGSMSPSARRTLLYHELGHFPTSSVLKQKDWVDTLAPFKTGTDRWKNPFGLVNNPEEIWADAYLDGISGGLVDWERGGDRWQIINRVHQQAAKMGLPVGPGFEPSGAPIPVPPPAPPPFQVPVRQAQFDAVEAMHRAAFVLNGQNGYAWSDGRVVTPDEVAAAFNAKIDKVLQGATLRTRIPDESVLNQILNDGRFKSQFETETSMGLMSPRSRAKTENQYFGYGYDPDDSTTWGMDPAQRPIYGYWRNPGRIESEVENYGGIAVQFKSSVKDRSSFTMTDSLVEGQRMAAVPYSMRSTHGWLAQELDTTLGDSGRGQFRYLMDAIEDFRGGPMGKDGFYVEAQIHGQAKVSDIDRIVFTDGKPTKRMQKRLDDLGIPWEYIPGDINQ